MDGILRGDVYGLVGADEIHVCRLIVHHACLCVLGEIQHHGSWSATSCNIEGTAHGPCYIFGLSYLEGPFGDGLSDTDDIHFLKSICSQHGCTYLSADDYHRGGVYHGICHASDGVHGTWPTGDDGASHLTGYSCVTLCCMYCTLFVAH